MDDDTARRRLLIYTLVRFGGLVILFLGIAAMYTRLLRPGGWPQVGAIIAIFGVIVSLLTPRLIKKRWDAQDRG